MSMIIHSRALNVSLGLVDPGRPWSALVGPCRPWSVLVGPGRSWPVLVGPGRSWSALVGPGRSWPVLVGPGRSWPVLVGPGRSWSVLVGPGRPWPLPGLGPGLGAWRAWAWARGCARVRAGARGRAQVRAGARGRAQVRAGSWVRVVRGSTRFLLGEWGLRSSRRPFRARGAEWPKVVPYGLLRGNAMCVSRLACGVYVPQDVKQNALNIRGIHEASQRASHALNIRGIHEASRMHCSTIRIIGWPAPGSGVQGMPLQMHLQ